jgi:hypothetical protein
LNAQKLTCETKQDPFTNDKKTVFYYSTNVDFPTFEYDFKTKKIVYNMYSNFSGQHSNTFPDGYKIQFKFSDDSIIELNAFNELEPVPSANPMSVYTQYTFKFELSKEDILKFANNDIAFFRQPTPLKDEFLSKDSKGKNYWKILKKGAKCISESL